MNILGMPLFVDYYTIHNPETGVVGFAPHTASTKNNVRTEPFNIILDTLPAVRP